MLVKLFLVKFIYGAAMNRSVLIILVQIMFLINLYSQSTPYVILISLDGFRWDYSLRELTPNLDKMKQDGVNAMSLRPSFPSTTFPNHYSMITGMYTENHGLISNGIWDPFTGERFSMGTKESKWFLGEAFWETANRSGITTASFFWPGSEMDLDYRRPDYFQPYSDDKDYLERVDTVIYWLQLPDSLRSHFITLYFHDTDKYGHRYGPNSPGIDESIARVDSLIGELHTACKIIRSKIYFVIPGRLMFVYKYSNFPAEDVVNFQLDRN